MQVCSRYVCTPLPPYRRVSILYLVIRYIYVSIIPNPRATFSSLSGKLDKDYERADETLHLVDLIALTAKYTPPRPPSNSPLRYLSCLGSLGTVVLRSYSTYSVPFDLVPVSYACGSQLWQVISFFSYPFKTGQVGRERASPSP